MAVAWTVEVGCILSRLLAGAGGDSARLGKELAMGDAGLGMAYRSGIPGCAPLTLSQLPPPEHEWVAGPAPGLQVVGPGVGERAAPQGVPELGEAMGVSG